MLIDTPSTFLKQLNERRLLNAVRLAGRVSRADIERQLKLATPTVSRIVERLIEGGWLRKVGYADSTGGRPPMLMEINPQGIGAIGIELGRNTVRIVYSNLLGETLVRSEFPATELGTPQHLVEYILEFMKQSQLCKELVIGVGIASPGTLDSTSDLSRDSGPMWVDVPIVQILEDGLEMPAYLANDANAAALGETWFGIGTRAKHVAFVLVDAGIGAGLAIDGSIYEGAENNAGEFSHAIVDLHGDLCTDGHRGCVNIAAAQPAILRAVRKVRPTRDDETLEHIIERARNGLSPDVEVIGRALDYLAAGITNLIRIFDPHMVILGGQTMLSNEFMVNQTIDRVTQFQSPDKCVAIQPTYYGLWAVAVGASTLVLQHIYDHTGLVDSTY